MAEANQSNDAGNGAGNGAGDGAAAGAGAGGAPPASIALADLTAAGIPDTYIKDGKFDAKAFGTDFGAGQTLRTQMAERAKAVPADGKYDFALPKDWKAPEGLDATGFEWNAPAELTARFAERAKAKGMTQADVSEFISDWAAGDLAKKTAAVKAQQDWAAAEDKKLGDNPQERQTNLVKAMGANFAAVLGDEKAGAELASGIQFADAATLLHFEKFINGLSSKLAGKSAGAGGPKANGDASALVGTKDGARKLLDAAYAAKN